MKTRVVIVERPTRDKIDLSRAAEHGELVVLTDMSRNQISAFDPGAYIKHVSESLDAIKFDPTTDLLCVVGPVLPVSILISVAAMKYSVLTLLCYHVHQQSYVPRTIDMRRLANERAH